MNKDLLNFIAELSRRDPKTLTAKVLKTTEETGELAKAVLAYTAADGSKHKFADKQKVLEEVVDTMLGALSVAYNLEFTHEQVENMLYQKASYWAKLQAKEKKSPFPVPFELHVSILPQRETIPTFKEICQELEVKPIVLELTSASGEKILEEIMTSSKFFGDNVQVQEELERISSRLSLEGFEVVRRKIETAPWHPAAPSQGLGRMKKGNYFEAHMDVKIPYSAEESLNLLAASFGALVSHNERKKTDTTKTYILTLRAYSGFAEEFTEKVKKLQECLLENNFEVERPNVEYSFFDSKASHDAVWSNNS